MSLMLVDGMLQLKLKWTNMKCITSNVKCNQRSEYFNLSGTSSSVSELESRSHAFVKAFLNVSIRNMPPDKNKDIEKKFKGP